jgi:tripartite-type tricarboxylate transporter receptor subunit TctC
MTLFTGAKVVIKAATKAVTTLLCSFALLSTPLAAESLSHRPITFVVPFTPGTGPDVLARLVGNEIQKRWGQPVVVENKPGASGNLGAHAVARAAPDGHTIMVTTNQLTGAVSLFAKVPYDPIRSFVPIIKLGTGAIALCVHPSVPVETISEFVAFVKRHSGDIDYGSPGIGGPHHLAMERFKQVARLDIKHVPYRGSAGAAQDIVGGHVAAGFLSLSLALPLARANSVRIIGVALQDRSSVAPTLATISEQGVTGFEVELWFGMLAPAGTPQDIVARYNTVVNDILRDPQVIQAAAKQGVSLQGGTAKQFEAFLEADLALWKRVIVEAGITPR